MGFEIENAISIDNYLENAKATAITKKIFTVDWGNKTEEYTVYRIPLNLLTYSFENIRIETDMKRHERKDGFLDFERKEDRIKFEEKFEKWLNQNHAKELRDDIQRIGQLDPGIITHGGVIIDGNRRYMVLKKISASYDANKWPHVDVGFMKVIRLEEGTSKKRLLELQARIQMAKKPWEPYRPINVLLGIQRLQNSGFNDKDIAEFFHLKINEIQNKKSQLGFIEDFLIRIKHDQEYELVDSKRLSPDHFEELRKQYDSLSRSDLNPVDMVKSKQLIKKLGFKLLEINIDPKMIELGKTFGGRDDIRHLKKIIEKTRNHERLEELTRLGSTTEEKTILYDKMMAEFFIAKDRMDQEELILIASQIINKIDKIDETLMNYHLECDFRELKNLINRAGKKLIETRNKVNERIVK